MKKIFLLLTLTAGLNFAVNAQKPISLGIKAGLALPNMSTSVTGISVSTSSKTSFYVGGVADIKMAPLFSLQTGLTYIDKGGKIDLSNFSGGAGTPQGASGDATTNLSYLELPINLMVNLNAGPAGKVFIGAGPYVSYALSGNEKWGTLKKDIEFGSGEDQVKRLDFGFNLLGGYQLKSGLNIHAGYGFGISNIASDNSGGVDVTTKNRVVTVGLGFMF